jgi:hypothetical protein
MSFLLEVDSSVAPSVILKSTTIFQIRKKSKKSFSVWVYIRIFLEDEDPDLLYYFYYK